MLILGAVVYVCWIALNSLVVGAGDVEVIELRILLARQGDLVMALCWEAGSPATTAVACFSALSTWAVAVGPEMVVVGLAALAVEGVVLGWGFGGSANGPRWLV